MNLSIFSNIIEKCRKQLQAGSIWVNTWNFFTPQTPCGGYKQSGFGRVGSKYAVDNFTKVKSFAQAIL